MANAANVKVSVEQAIHKALSCVIRKAWKEHGLEITRVDVNWDDGLGRRYPATIEVETRSKV